MCAVKARSWAGCGSGRVLTLGRREGGGWGGWWHDDEVSGTTGSCGDPSARRTCGSRDVDEVPIVGGGAATVSCVLKVLNFACCE